MRKFGILLVMAFGLGVFLQSCNNGKTYAEQKEEERDAIRRFIDKQDIKVISFEQFQEQDSTTNVANNEFVLFSESGVYMQIVEKGNGEPMEDGRHELLARYEEKEIETEGTDTLATSNLYYAYPDELMVTRSGTSYSASFTSGIMSQYYGTSVPAGWLQPLDFIFPGRQISGRAKVKLIVPHSKGTSTALSMVTPYYYEITYQLSR